MNTEGINPRSKNLHKMSCAQIVELMNSEDELVVKAVKAEAENIARAVDIVVDVLKSGGTLYYFGAGTSGRLGVLDASECPPTFNFDRIKGIIAGGDYALRNAVEGAEDDFEAGVRDAQILKENDAALLISASGNPKYLCAVAQKAQCPIIALTNNPEAKINKYAKVTICPRVGEEIIAGSSRLKAGTSQKMVLNMISTASMVKLGKVYENLMIDVQPANEKLKKRAISIVQKIINVDEDCARKLLTENNFNVREAINHMANINSKPRD